MMYVVVAALIVAWIAGLLYLIDRGFFSDGEWKFAVRVLFLAYVTISLAGLFAIFDAAEQRGPCLRYETGYAMAGKVMTPYRYCAERGEWIR